MYLSSHFAQYSREPLVRQRVQLGWGEVSTYEGSPSGNRHKAPIHWGPTPVTCFYRMCSENEGLTDYQGAGPNSVSRQLDRYLYQDYRQNVVNRNFNRIEFREWQAAYALCRLYYAHRGSSAGYKAPKAETLTDGRTPIVHRIY